MTERIQALLGLTLKGDMYVEPVKTTFDRSDIFLTQEDCDVKRLCEYILNQEPKLTPYSRLTGFFNFDGSVVGDAFHRSGHRETGRVLSLFYCKQIDNLSTMEWQHATADYRKVLKVGIRGIQTEIDGSIAVHKGENDKVAFLRRLRKVGDVMIGWARKCAERTETYAAALEDADARNGLHVLAETLRRVPENAPETFYEAVLTIYLCFSADPDSLGTLDRYLSPFYEADLAAGRITRDEAKEYLQELFLMLQAATPADSKCFTRGGESHFCVGGYLPNGSDGFCETTKLIVEAMTDLPTYIPQLTFRWTKKTPHDVLAWMMDAERRDPHKRIAFTNDEKRIKCYTEICGFPFADAVNYTTVGCNEPAFCGAITGSNSKINILRSTETLFHRKADEVRRCADFEAYYALFEREMFSDLDAAYAWDDKYNSVRARDVNYISSLFFNGCIEKGKSLTQGGGTVVIASPMLLGITNVIDALIVVKQFVFDEKSVTIDELIRAVQANWKGYEDLRARILRDATFFGNDDERSNAVARRFYESLYQYLKDKTNLFGYHWLVGDLVGYNEHHKWFCERMKATPDGRHDGEMIKFGLGQSEGRDHEGLTALLNSLAKVDPHGIACGSTVTNVLLDKSLVEKDANFEKLTYLFETYFRQGGVHFQLTYVSHEELVAAKACPAEHKSLRVRVTGFSDYFVNLNGGLQDDIIRRTEIEG